MNTTRPRVISGTVCDAGGKPLPNARVYFVRGPAPLPVIAAITDSRGSFLLTAPVRGDYEIECMADDAGSSRVQVDVRDRDLRVELSLNPELKHK